NVFSSCSFLFVSGIVLTITSFQQNTFQPSRPELLLAFVRSHNLDVTFALQQINGIVDYTIVSTLKSKKRFRSYNTINHDIWIGLLILIAEVQRFLEETASNSPTHIHRHIKQRISDLLIFNSVQFQN